MAQYLHAPILTDPSPRAIFILPVSLISGKINFRFSATEAGPEQENAKNVASFRIVRGTDYITADMVMRMSWFVIMKACCKPGVACLFQ
jgi:hypothetical protein